MKKSDLDSELEIIDFDIEDGGIHISKLIDQGNSFSKEYILKHEDTDKLKMAEVFVVQNTYHDDIDCGNELTLTTIHQSKGLEWPIVCVVHVNEGFLPSRSSSIFIYTKHDQRTVKQENLMDLEEERRLLYVATTRAESLLLISSIQNKNKAVPSRFIKEIPEQYLNIENFCQESVVLSAKLFHKNGPVQKSLRPIIQLPSFGKGNGGVTYLQKVERNVVESRRECSKKRKRNSSKWSNSKRKKR
eukprot:TRINITY_DN11711_c0_g1_i1.p1 TRINITY_DN11711_c0_g1~~TRINITY_DN11711_c0_g1_i1.p1  ORF type:complete len:275 (+),score=49.99 TRINITY_DN11711_c0_g1_i1:93-827(+)